MYCTASITHDNTLVYPMHSHTNWEVMYYISGNGYMKFKDNKIPFSPGTLIAVPAGIKHGSVSKFGFKNISVSWNFGKYFKENKPFYLTDNQSNDGRRLAEIIYNNQYADNDFLLSLLTAYALFITNESKRTVGNQSIIDDICIQIRVSFSDSDFKTEDLLEKSGYAPDYIRQQFKKSTGKTPIEFLKNVRITHAKRLMEIYGKSISIKSISAMCGFSDAVYFSRCFKEISGLSPRDYLSVIPKSFKS